MVLHGFRLGNSHTETTRLSLEDNVKMEMVLWVVTSYGLVVR
jgi:hypothetical protein